MSETWCFFWFVYAIALSSSTPNEPSTTTTTMKWNDSFYFSGEHLTKDGERCCAAIYLFMFGIPTHTPAHSRAHTMVVHNAAFSIALFSYSLSHLHPCAFNSRLFTQTAEHHFRRCSCLYFVAQHLPCFCVTLTFALSPLTSTLVDSLSFVFDATENETHTLSVCVRKNLSELRRKRQVLPLLLPFHRLLRLYLCAQNSLVFWIFSIFSFRFCLALFSCFSVFIFFLVSFCSLLHPIRCYVFFFFLLFILLFLYYLVVPVCTCCGRFCVIVVDPYASHGPQNRTQTRTETTTSLALVSVSIVTILAHDISFSVASTIFKFPKNEKRTFFDTEIVLVFSNRLDLRRGKIIRSICSQLSLILRLYGRTWICGTFCDLFLFGVWNYIWIFKRNEKKKRKENKSICEL